MDFNDWLNIVGLGVASTRKLGQVVRFVSINHIPGDLLPGGSNVATDSTVRVVVR